MNVLPSAKHARLTQSPFCTFARLTTVNLSWPRLSITPMVYKPPSKRLPLPPLTLFCFKIFSKPPSLPSFYLHRSVPPFLSRSSGTMVKSNLRIWSTDLARAVACFFTRRELDPRVFPDRSFRAGCRAEAERGGDHRAGLASAGNSLYLRLELRSGFFVQHFLWSQWRDTLVFDELRFGFNCARQLMVATEWSSLLSLVPSFRSSFWLRITWLWRWTIWCRRCLVECHRDRSRVRP